MNHFLYNKQIKVQGLYVLLACLLAFSLISSHADAQGFYLRVGGGYSFESAKTEFSDADPNGLTGITQSTDITVSADGSTATVTSLKGSLGAGVKFNATPGYMFNRFIGAELGINYFCGDETLIGRLHTPTTHSEEIAYIRGLDVAPAILLTPGFETINPYVRLGLLIPVAGDLTIETSVDRPNGGGAGTDIAVRGEAEVTPKFSLGYTGAIGIIVPVTDRFSIFGEAEFKSLSIKSDEAEITSYTTTATTDGQTVLVPGEQLEDLPVSEKKFIFKDEFTTSAEEPTDEPRVIPSQEVNASSAGLNIGVRIGF